MHQGEFFLAIQALTPLICYMMMRLLIGSPTIAGFVYRLSPVLFLTNLTQLFRLVQKNEVSLSFFEAFRTASISIIANHFNLGFCAILGILWLIFTFYIEGFFDHQRSSKATKIRITELTSWNLKSSILLIFALINLAVLSKNLFTLLFAQIGLMLAGQSLAVNYLQKRPINQCETNQNGANNQQAGKHFFILPFLLYLQIFLLFLAIVATYKANGNLEFVEKLTMPNLFNETTYRWLLFLYSCGLFLLIMAPCYFFIGQLNFTACAIYLLFFLLLGFGNLVALAKILNYVIGSDAIEGLLGNSSFRISEIILLLNLIIFSAMLLWARNLKSAIFYLFFHQLTFLLFAIFSFSGSKINLIYPTILGFCCNYMAAFLCASNLSLFEDLRASIQSSAKSKTSSAAAMNSSERILNRKFPANGQLFSQLPINCCLLIFSLLAMAGLAPGIGAVEKLALITKTWQEKLPLAAIMIAVNFCSLAAFAWKFFSGAKKEKGSTTHQESDFSKNLDKNHSRQSLNSLESRAALSQSKIQQKLNLNESSKAESLKTGSSQIDQDSRLVLSPLLLLILGLIALLFSSSLAKFFL